MADYSVSSINLAAVKHYDGHAKEILDKATQVALYTFNGDKNEWKKTEVEGALFVYSRTVEPYHNIIIMNRLNTFNLVEPVVPGLDIQEHAPFLLYRNNRLDIFGIWFYDKSECERIARVLDTLVKDWDKRKNDKQPIKTEKHPPPKVINVSANNNNNSVDICSLLSRAQEEYNSGKVPVSPLTSNEGRPTAPTQSVLDFFAKASSSSKLNKEKAPPVQPPGLAPGLAPGLFVAKGRAPAPEPVEATLKPLMQRLMSNPVHSVEHIEKQQRSVTPQQNDLATTPDKAPTKEPKQRVPGIPILDHQQEAPQKPELMPPVMFTSSSTKPYLQSTPKSLNKSVPNPLNIVQALNESLSEIPARPAVTQSPISKPEPLTKNQLLQAFSYLLKNDPDFVNTLHAAYVKSFAEIVP